MFEIESKQMAGAIGSALEPQCSPVGLRGAVLELITPRQASFDRERWSLGPALGPRANFPAGKWAG